MDHGAVFYHMYLDNLFANLQNTKLWNVLQTYLKYLFVMSSSEVSYSNNLDMLCDERNEMKLYIM